MNYDETDLQLTDDYDLLLAKNRGAGNFKRSSWQDNTLVEQILLQRIQTNIDEFGLNRVITASLNHELGNKIDGFLLDSIRSRIFQVLTIDGAFSRENIEINLVIKDDTNVIISIIIKNLRLASEINNVVYLFSYNANSNLTVNNF